MIWLAPMAGTEEGSVYFEIRDIAVRRNGTDSCGLVSGLLGDGQHEVWAEVELGADAQVRILPLVTESGQLETLSASIDEELLQQQLLQAVEELLAFCVSRPLNGLPRAAMNPAAHTTPLRQPAAA